ncbi:Thiamine-monophosphate kinase [Candidatus Hydrogenisulfobacillus filiaventi]|uniref:Thiamine-monophosphate kinase n=1 Tax=Candidatus Hydrogenisulfobacillus filiaventi TaxID=2707344 RepID=A0A6F8ZI03_9FIRM|nr:Thiamine-monophosphate kinase [Candidatus Hydrogenisulfobacillus filiaventi]
MTENAVKVRELGEQGLIAMIHRLQAQPPLGTIGIGDDAAYVPAPAGGGWLVTSDMLVEGIHFRFDWTDPEQLGDRAVAVNMSDIAAMGGVPRVALTSISIPGDYDSSRVEAIYRGVARALDRYHAVLVGGDTVGGVERLVLDVTVLGEPGPAGPIARRGARPGDRLVVTGRLGAAYAGYRLLEAGHRWPGTSSWERSVLRAQLSPEARVACGQLLAPLAHALTDVSDGLQPELQELTRFGGIGARIYADRLPVDRATRKAAARLGEDPLDWALFGGEDYELLAAVPPSRVGEAQRRVAAEGFVLTEIGEITDQPGIRLVRGEEEVKLDAGGFDHFRLEWAGLAAPRP